MTFNGAWHNLLAKGAQVVQTAEYQIQLQSADPKSGKIESLEDGLPTLEFASPPEFGGPGGVWTPEHLYVGAVSSCLMTTFRAIADMAGVEVVSYTDDATGTLVRGEDRLYRIDTVILRPHVVVPADKDLTKAERLLRKAESVCLIGRSVNTTILLEPTVTIVAS